MNKNDTMKWEDIYKVWKWEMCKFPVLSAQKYCLKTEISNKAEENSEINIRTEVFDKEGNIVIGDERIETINSNSFVNEVRSQYEIKNVHLWNGTIDPYLYMVKITISDKDGNILDF